MTVDLPALLSIRFFGLTKKDQTGKLQRESLSTLWPTFSDPVKSSPLYKEKCWPFLQEGGNRSFFPELAAPGAQRLQSFLSPRLCRFLAALAVPDPWSRTGTSPGQRQPCRQRAQKEKRGSPAEAGGGRSCDPAHSDTCRHSRPPSHGARHTNPGALHLPPLLTLHSRENYLLQFLDITHI